MGVLKLENYTSLIETNTFKDKECNETMIFILRSQQLQ